MRLLLLTFLGALTFLPLTAECCQIGGLRLMPVAAYAASAAVFVAKVVQVEPLEEGWDRVLVDVDETLKGEAYGRVALAIRNSTVGDEGHVVSCRGFIGDSFIVYAKRRTGSTTAEPPLLFIPKSFWDGQLIAWSTQRVEDSGSTLQALRELE